MNDPMLQKAKTWFNELDVQTVDAPDCLKVSRDGMVKLGMDDSPEKAYDMILAELRGFLGSKRVYWAGKDDDFVYLGCF